MILCVKDGTMDQNAKSMFDCLKIQRLEKVLSAQNNLEV